MTFIIIVDSIMITFYDLKGRAVAFTNDDETIFLFNRESPVAFFDGEEIWSFHELKHIGWFVDGWIIDRDEKYVLFTKKAKGGPERPPITGTAPRARVRRPIWSQLSGKQFFEQ